MSEKDSNILATKELPGGAKAILKGVDETSEEIEAALRQGYRLEITVGTTWTPNKDPEMHDDVEIRHSCVMRAPNGEVWESNWGDTPPNGIEEAKEKVHGLVATEISKQFARVLKEIVLHHLAPFIQIVISTGEMYEGNPEQHANDVAEIKRRRAERKAAENDPVSGD